MTFTNGVAGLVVMSGLITIAEKAHIHFFDRTPDSPIVMFERFDIMSQKVPFDVAAADLFTVACDLYIGTITEKALIADVFFGYAGAVVMDDSFLVPPEVGRSFNGSSGSGQGVEQIFEKSSFSSSHSKISFVFCCY